ncbi:MFS general substrate transporter [Gonapodya prolifera JEL478]|uniref:MFS general substrate transporter n=1 Tax=Gonapodya prolifera (strain JEL478) TaxID=1344416 RepID=A0A139AET9_GONPJ|nr:MFS general substrate transporter [Gonapodya prolifera JEL478]|eukprot:KXS15189.1 MFS general substrate transporter [Gonapodya prolifera JEL478]
MKIPLNVDKTVYLGSAKRPLREDENGRATEINLASFRRVHMRSFWLSTLGFFAAFTAWFATTTLLPSIKADTGISDASASASDIANVSSNIVFRIMVGPLLDAWGSRRVMSALLISGSLALIGSAGVTNGVGLIVSRTFIGLLGAVFVPCQYWTQSLFSYNVVGAANALSAGWGNLGAGVAYLVTPQIHNLLTFLGVSASASWRLTLLFPAIFGLLAAALCLAFGDDRPISAGFDPHALSDGVILDKNPSDVTVATVINDPASSETHRPVKTSLFQEVFSFVKLSFSPTVLILMFMYACSFGVELCVDSKLGAYLSAHFLRPDCDPTTDVNKCQYLNQSTAGLLGSTFGLLNLFTRALGGFVSDYAASRSQHRLVGRLIVQLVVLLVNGAALILFSYMTDLASAMAVLVIFSILTEAACGTTFALVPFVDPWRKGAVSGLVGAGGNIGGALFNVLFQAYLNDPSKGFFIMGVIVAVSSLLTFCLSIGGVRGWREMCGR